MFDTARSHNGTAVRLTDERWAHITEEHAELAGMRADVLDAVASSDKVLAGNTGELFAVKSLGERRNLVVVYRELAGDGFVITAFITTRMRSLSKRKQLWP